MRRPSPLARVGEVLDAVRGLAPIDTELPAPPPVDAWTGDVLGRGHEARTIPLPDDAEGEVVATLVRYRPEIDARRSLPRGAATEPIRFAVIYLHGWSDYFLNHEIGPFWADNGGALYALDLRKYGRSLRAHQTPGYVDDLTTYDEDIDAALEIVQSEHPDLPVVFMAHSTGGLTISLWAERHPGRAAGLVLVAPWLETQGSSLVRTLSTPIVTEIAKAAPMRLTPQPDLGFYHRTIASDAGGEWDLVPAWRPTHSFPARYGWLAAVLRGHGRIAQGLWLDLPVLVVLSRRSLIAPVWDEAMTGADIVIEVDVVAQRALLLSHHVTVSRIEGALHDVLLSRREVRDAAYDDIARWARGYL